MDIFELLKEDHEVVSGLIKKIEARAESPGEDRDSLFLEMKRELEVHSFLEEKLFYSKLEERTAVTVIAAEAREEHRIIKALLEELEDETLNADEWKAKFEVLKENVEHHVREEEGPLFKKARAILTTDEAQKLGARFSTEKAQMKATP